MRFFLGMNRLLTLFFLFAVLISCDNEVKDTALIYNIPDHSKIVIALSDLQEVTDLLENNPVFDQLESLSRVKEIKTASSFLNTYDLKSESFVTLSMEGKNQVAITLLTEVHDSQTDSTTVVKRIEYNDVEILEKTADGNTYYTANKNGSHMASSSILVLESLIRRNLTDYVFDESFVTLYERTHDDISIYVNASDEQWLYQFLLGKNKTDAHNYGEWYQLEPSMTGNSIYMDGLIVYKDSLNQKHSLYNDLDARENQLDQVAPATFRFLSSTTYSDPEQLMGNLSRYHNRKPVIPELLKDLMVNSQEVSTIELENGTAIAFSLLPFEDLFVDLDSLSAAKSTYRDVALYTLAAPLDSKSIAPLVPNLTVGYLTLIDRFLVLSANQETLEEIIAGYQNGTTLSSQNWWKEAREKMSSSSSLLNVTSLEKFKNPFISIDEKDDKVLKSMDDTTLKAMISQYVHEDAYAFYRLEIPYGSTAAEQPLVAQIGSYKSESDIIAGPFLFPNHLNNTYDVAIQTEDFKLTLLSETGEVHWTKELNTKILGEIQSVDVYKNDRKQLLFANQEKVYLLDRKGNDVDKFPYNPKKDITQPLSVFDYDNNRNYRFVITTGKDLTMLDSKGNKVSGFNYRPDGIILNSPQHFRKGNKDYIAFTTDQKELKLINRTGETRTSVKTKIEAKSDLYFYNNLIQFVNSDDKLLHVNPSTGKVTVTNTSLDTDSHIGFTSRSQLIQNKNVLQINGTKSSLPYGTYLPARLSRINNKDYVTIIDNGENKVYILNDQGETVPFLPVYGNTAAQIAGGKSRYLVTLDGNEVLIYKW
ncbi:hypothetical protein BST86_07980 [Nonlabens agnitus]|uniref:Uncharacterized protein n=2 Tax=Nonlabens agnitus TaxID=870484 RepID=A0A2S9WU97_9FLAO|nr:hypothetical protein BST86_07980 [Nonlabens agnitus]